MHLPGLNSLPLYAPIRFRHDFPLLLLVYVDPKAQLC